MRHTKNWMFATILSFQNGVAGFYKADANSSLKAGQCYLSAETTPTVVMP